MTQLKLGQSIPKDALVNQLTARNLELVIENERLTKQWNESQKFIKKLNDRLNSLMLLKKNITKELKDLKHKNLRRH